MLRRLFAILVFLFFATGMIWAEVTFTARVRGGNSVEAGTRFQVEYEVNDALERFSCDVESSGLRVLSGPSSSSYMSRSMTNGKTTVSQTTTMTYVMVANKEGNYTIPSASAVVDGKTYSSNQLNIKVLPADPNKQQSASSSGKTQTRSSGNAIDKNDVILSVDVSKSSLYEGEALVATLKLYFRNQQVSNVTDVKFPDLEGFTAQEIDLGDDVQATLEQYRGESYRAYPLRQWLLFPQHSGDIKIKPASLSAIVQVYTGRRSFWDDPFNVYQNVQVPLTSAERTVSVKSLPAGKPASYMNAVGEFTVKSELTSTQVKANDALIYRVTIEGTGNLKYVREPHPEFPADFEVYDPKTDVKSRTTRNGVSGRKVIEYTIIPRFAGSFQIPPLEFSYFDTKTSSYQTLTTEGFTLEVEKGANDNASATGGGSTDYSGTTQERIKVLGSDIRYIHPIDPKNLKEEDAPLFGSLLYWMAMMIPALALIVLIFVNRRRLKLSADLEGQRTRKANKVATRHLRTAAAALKGKKETEFYEAVHKAMMGYVADKLNIQMSDLTTDGIRQQLAERKVEEALIKQCVDVLQTCEFARYAPSSDSQAMDKLYAQADQTIGLLEKNL